MQSEMRLDGKICRDFYILLEFGKNNLVLRFLAANTQRKQDQLFISWSIRLKVMFLSTLVLLFRMEKHFYCESSQSITVSFQEHLSGNCMVLTALIHRLVAYNTSQYNLKCRKVKKIKNLEINSTRCQFNNREITFDYCRNL